MMESATQQVPSTCDDVPKSSLIEAASLLADELVEEAVEWNGMATWLGNDLELEATGALRNVSPIGSTLYAGVSGGAHFLAHMALTTGEQRYRDLALKACRYVIQDAGSQRRLDPDYFTGHTGSIAVVLEALDICGRPELADELIQRAHTAVWNEPTDDNPSDLVGGLAGQVVGLLVLSERLSIRSAPFEATPPALLNALQRLLGRSRGPDGLGLRSRCGASHGPSGMAWSVGRAAQAGFYDEVDANRLQRRLCDLEDRCLSAESNNWIDPARAPSAAEHGQMAWCHGAPGVLLLRSAMAGVQWTPEEIAGREKAALAALLNVELELTSPTPRVSLCHGTCGTASALLAAAEWVAMTFQREAADTLVRTATRVAEDIRDGLVLRETAGLGFMTGRPGIGSFLLSLAGTNALWPLFAHASLSVEHVTQRHELTSADLAS